VRMWFSRSWQEFWRTESRRVC